MFIFKQWGKRSAMSGRIQRGEKINLAYEPDELQRLARSAAKGVARTLDVSTPAGSERCPIVAIKDKSRTGAEATQRSVINTSSKPKPCDFDLSCKCQNCRALSNLTECGVCFDSLQSSQIKSCQICANVVCTGCAVRLTKCAFCRSSLPPERNRALERLVDRLVLPCKNSRSGCKVMLNGESRFIHESICNFSSTNCPVGRGICGWYGTVANIQSHLQSVHNLQPLKDHGISIEIHSFRSKAKANGGRVYTVCLVCYEQLFVIRIVLYQSQLRLCFTRLGHAEPQPLPEREQRLPRYGILVSLKAHSPSGRHQLRGLVPFGKFDRDGREVSFTCDSLYRAPAEPLPHQGCPRQEAAACREDLVKIDLLVKRLDEPN